MISLRKILGLRRKILYHTVDLDYIFCRLQALGEEDVQMKGHYTTKREISGWLYRKNPSEVAEMLANDFLPNKKRYFRGRRRVYEGELDIKEKITFKAGDNRSIIWDDRGSFSFIYNKS